MTKRERVACNFCGADDARPVFSTYDMWYDSGQPTGEKERHCIVQCRRCGLAYVSPRVPPSEIEDYYPAEYSPHTVAAVRPVPPSSLGRFTMRLRRTIYDRWKGEETAGSWWQGLLSYPFSLTRYARYDPFYFVGEGLRLLDIGCGIGDYLARKKALGWDVYGVEPSQAAVNRCHQRGLTNVQRGYFSAHLWPACFFDVVVMQNVLEHVGDPMSLLAEIIGSLKPNGVLYVMVPNFASIPEWLFRQYWIGIEVPRHYYYYSPRPLLAMLKRACYQPIGWYTQSSTSGFTAGVEFILRERCKRHVTRDSVRKSRAWASAALPFVRLSDLIKLGDNLHALALKPA